MSLTHTQVVKIAHLARLELTAAEAERYAPELSGILDLVAQMEAADTTGVTPMAHPLDQVQRLRPDQVTETDQRELFQGIAPRTAEGLYLVPKVID